MCELSLFTTVWLCSSIVCGSFIKSWLTQERNKPRKRKKGWKLKRRTLRALMVLSTNNKAWKPHFMPCTLQKLYVLAAQTKLRFSAQSLELLTFSIEQRDSNYLATHLLFKGCSFINLGGCNLYRLHRFWSRHWKVSRNLYAKSWCLPVFSLLFSSECCTCSFLFRLGIHYNRSHFFHHRTCQVSCGRKVRTISG